MPSLIFLFLKIAKLKSKSLDKAIQEFYDSKNTLVEIFESPYLQEEFIIHYVSKEKIFFISSPDFINKLRTNDFLLLLNFVHQSKSENLFLIKIMEYVWRTIFGIPFILINLPTLLRNNRIFIIDKFLIIPIFVASEYLISLMIGPTFLQKIKNNSGKFSFVNSINEDTLGPSLIFILNSSYFRMLRN